jgi:tol-pal system protein YbgF
MRHPILYALMVSAIATSVSAGTRARLDTLEAQAANVDERITQIERVLNNQSLLEVMSEMESLRQEVRELRSEVEQIRHDLDGARDRQRDLYVDLDRRLLALETTGVSSVPTPSTATTDQASDGAASAPPSTTQVTDREAYQAAYELVRQSQYQQAAAGFQQFLGTYLDSPLRDNAQYWLGEMQYVTRNFEVAVEMFEAVLSQYPGSRKTPDALLKLGFAQYELQRWDDARASLSRVVSEFPDATAAGLAQQRLDRMAQEGR